MAQKEIKEEITEETLELTDMDILLDRVEDLVGELLDNHGYQVGDRLSVDGHNLEIVITNKKAR